ncbi:MAG: hypothetical protein IPL78_14310 [Chloroflexi bacterium]|nr:hypothetical protein [Chloroflexota bacterium]
MLFRPVYGPELEVIYTFIKQSPTPVSRQAIFDACLPHYGDKRTLSPQSIDDALSFLAAALIIEDRDGFKICQTTVIQGSFRLTIIVQLQKLAQREVLPIHEFDVQYFLLLQELFIKPDRLYLADVHAEANKLRSVTELGGVSQEKIRSWKRVMAFLGIGRRVANGFQCVFAPTLLQEIIVTWHTREGFIQDLLEGHFIHYLPFQTQAGELAQAVRQPLWYLQQQQIVQMRAYQDASSKPYFGERRWRYLIYKGGVV